MYKSEGLSFYEAPGIVNVVCLSLCVGSMPKTDMTTAAGGYAAFQGHMSAHDLALNQATQQQGYIQSSSTQYLQS